MSDEAFIRALRASKAKTLEWTIQIACAICGWEEIPLAEDDDERIEAKYRAAYQEYDAYLVIDDVVDLVGQHHDGFPDFRSLDGCRQFETELGKRGMLKSYAQHLNEIVEYKNAEEAAWRHGNYSLTWPEFVLLRADPYERIMACVRCLGDMAQIDLNEHAPESLADQPGGVGL